jgi:fatty-acyl-CoA synthase
VVRASPLLYHASLLVRQESEDDRDATPASPARTGDADAVSSNDVAVAVEGSGGPDLSNETLARLRSRTLWQTILAAAQRFPERDALVAANDSGEVQRCNYRTLVDRVRSLSAGLASIGVRRGDRLVLWMTNTPEWVVSSFAAMRLGAAVVPVNTFLKPVEVKYVISQSGARHLLMLDGFRQLNMPSMLSEIAPEFSQDARPGFLFSDDLPDLRNIAIFHRSGGSHPGAYDFGTLEGMGQDTAAGEALQLADRMEQDVRPSDLGMVKYTSGSTGFPKGVMLEQGGIVANGVLHSRRIGVGASDVFFSMMPFFHGGGSIWGLMTMMVNGGTLVFTEAFNAALAVDLMERERATVFIGVLAQEVVAAAIEAGRVLPSLRVSHLPNDDAVKVMPNVTFTIVPFGLTETYGPAAVTSPEDPEDKRLTTSGRMLDGNTLRVVDPETGGDVGVGKVGEAWIRGNVMRGYWNKSDESGRAIDRDGWLHSEDLVKVDADGYVTYVGRVKLMLKVGGENVSIEEVETVVTSHEAVDQCGAVGVPDPRKHEVVRVYVVIRPGRQLQEAELRSWLESRLARFKMPRDIVLVAELPRLANGKLDRVGLGRLAGEETVTP